MEEDFIAKDTEKETLRERPEIPEDVEIGDEIEGEEMTDVMMRPGYNKCYPGIVNPTREEKQDPMLPLIYFSTGVFSALLAFLVFYACMRCSHKHKNCERGTKLAAKEDEK